jgi:transposase
MQRRQRDGRTHLAHKAEHAVDLETGAIVAVTLPGADLGDTTTVRNTLTAAGEQVVAADLPSTVQELIANKGYHSNETMTDCHTLGVRSYISEPDRGRRGELVERTFAHVYETGGIRRTHLRGHQNIYKRLIVHASGFNLGLLMRSVIGVGTPRSLQGRVAALIATIIHVWNLITTMVNPGAIRPRPISPLNS